MDAFDRLQRFFALGAIAGFAIAVASAFAEYFGWFASLDRFGELLLKLAFFAAFGLYALWGWRISRAG